MTNPTGGRNPPPSNVSKPKPPPKPPKAGMSDSQALAKLLELNKQSEDMILVLMPDESHDGHWYWDVYDALAAPTSSLAYEDTVLGRGKTVAEAVEQAAKKLEER